MHIDNALTRRLYTWIFGKPNMDNKYEIDLFNRPFLTFLIQAIMNIFNRPPEISKNPILPLKILQMFYMEHDHLIAETLPELSFHIIK